MGAQSWSTVGGVISVALFIYWTFVKQNKNVKNIQNKVVLITGASSGLGEACAKVFYKAGARIILCARRTEELERVKKSLMESKLAEDREPVVLPLDLTDESSMARKVQDAINIHGHIDIVINNGGISYRGEIKDTALDVDRKVMEVNYFGQVALTKALLPHLKQRKFGHVVFVSSIQGKLSVPFRSAYSASKHALQAFGDCLRSEVHDQGIQVSVVSPGYIATNLSLNAVTGDGSAYGAMDTTTASGMSPTYVAERILGAVANGQPEVILSSASEQKLAVYLRNILPGIFFRLMASRAAKQRKEQGEK